MASTISGTERDRALVFSEPTTAANPSRYPSRFAPASPMKTEAAVDF